ncbi:MAG TPA: sulfatase-like hydrolase/transferase [Spirochaetota bacterium]|nr:sulfatase-like hydrolase/transferase [Spirochaetota bacterium]HOK92791.1 sulfatase-like hydrolase/transferase [Spirochaetota bacterium]HPP95563.1 sulfatase-like hydrolase/transferase [Spirochaetota bacterium]HRS62323.1 sulfatase-like hydrolase/transferase [Spirochaetota bacterium]HRU66036.1 sulfatase-like hydrolase/transferase [Spirochaetota bacterium]
MGFSLKRFFHVNIAGFANLILWSLAFTFYLLIDRYSGSFDIELFLLGVYIFFSIVFLNALFFFIFKAFFIYFRYRSAMAYLLSNLIVTVVFVINNMSVAVYGKQLGMEGLVMALRGWQGGEMGNFTATVVQVFLVIAIYLFLYFFTYMFLNRLFSGRPFSHAFFGLLVCVISLVLVFVHFKLVGMADSDWKMNSMKHKIPWQSLTGFPDDLVRVDEDGKKGTAIPPLFSERLILSEKKEIEQLKRMGIYGKKILSGEISTHHPYNILFINVEGLRRDMLNPENMPFLYRFASDKAFILKKHYSTGNNTPGSLYGMLTGLAPYYFEPLRQNKLPNMALEVLKKAGYRQSVYYNSPRNYEHIYEDILVKTEHKFVRAAGTWEDDYAPRDRWLFENYIQELKKESNTSKRFDYILVNVTHFNYYYPPEFKKYTPDFRSDFKIISGPQSGFRKNKEELMNRYKNSVYYADYLLKNLLTEMEAMGRLKNTIIVIAGDHGEEFWEHGSFGHTWGLNDIQIGPAAIIYYPNIKNTDIKYKYTSHQDFLPTVFDIIGINVDYKYFTTGKSLLKYSPEKDYAISSLGILVSFKRNGYAIIGNGYKVLYRNNMDLNSSPYAIYDENDQPIEEFNKNAVSDLLLKAMNAKSLEVPMY